MRLLVFSDLQASDGSERCFGDPTIPLQRHRITLFYKLLKEAFYAHQCDGLVDLGDHTDDRTSIPIPTVNAVCEGLSPFVGVKNKSWKIIGNHEQWVKSGDLHVGRMFDHYFQVIPDVQTVVMGRTSVIFASYPSTDARLSETLQEVIGKARRTSDKVVLFGHFQVSGCSMAAGISLNGISKSVFQGVDLALLGHVHKPQEIIRNVFYVGSPFQQNYGESNENKRIAVVDTDTAKVEWIPLQEFPAYKVVSLSDFEHLSGTGNPEDRYRVTLRSHEEAERFYVNPACSRADPVYCYEEVEAVGEFSAPHEWSLESAVERYLEKVPPKSKGIHLPVEEMILFGRDIAQSE